MATLGNVPAEAYTNTVKDSFSGNGSATAFTMSLPTVTNDVRVVVENVIQDPTVAYSVSGTTLTFTSAPPTGTNNIYVVHLGPAAMTAVPPAEIADATTFASSLTVQGAFTSVGIDDNGNATAITIDSSENILAGKTSSAFNTAGFELFGNADKGKFWATRDGGVVAAFNRKSSDGDIALFAKDGTTVGSIRSNSGARLAVNSEGSFGLLQVEDSNCFFWSSLSLSPFNDNTRDLGESGFRYDDVYATNGTIQTSDFNEKQDIASLTATEMLVGKRISALFKTFRWKDSVAEKGDNARTHTGVIAQDVQAAFTAEGLDAGDYALFISSTWWETQTEVPAVEAVDAVEEVVDENGNVTTEAVEAVEAVDAYTRTDTYDTEDEAPEGATERTRLGIRYPELLSFVAAYNEQRFASIEARLTALEA